MHHKDINRGALQCSKVKEESSQELRVRLQGCLQAFIQQLFPEEGIHEGNLKGTRSWFVDANDERRCLEPGLLMDDAIHEDLSAAVFAAVSVLVPMDPGQVTMWYSATRGIAAKFAGQWQH